jgi:hypothetical protein
LDLWDGAVELQDPDSYRDYFGHFRLVADAVGNALPLPASCNIMQFTKTFLRLAVIGSIIFLSCSNQKDDRAKEGKLIFSAQVDNWIKEGDINYLLVRTSLTNSSPDTVTYITMSCSWQDVYTTDTKDLVISVNECDKNVPHLIKIPPHGRQDTDLKLKSEKSISQLTNLHFRLGLNLVTAL